MTFIFLFLSKKLKNLLKIFLHLTQNRSFFKLIFKFEPGSSNFIKLVISLLFFILLINFLSIIPVFGAAGVFNITNFNNLFPYFNSNFDDSIPYLNNNNNGDSKFLRLKFIFLVLEIFIIYLFVISVTFSSSKKFIYFTYILR